MKFQIWITIWISLEKTFAAIVNWVLDIQEMELHWNFSPELFSRQIFRDREHRQPEAQGRVTTLEQPGLLENFPEILIIIPVR